MEASRRSSATFAKAPSPATATTSRKTSVATSQPRSFEPLRTGSSRSTTSWSPRLSDRADRLRGMVGNVVVRSRLEAIRSGLGEVAATTGESEPDGDIAADAASPGAVRSFQPQAEQYSKSG